MPMKFKLLVCVVALLAFSAAAFGADIAFYTETFDGSTVPAYTLQGNWGIGVPLKGPAGPTVAASGTKVLAYNLNGDYGPNITPAQYAVTSAIDCTGKIGVKLQFRRWLGIQDSNNDQATVWVSNDNTNWTRIYLNPTNANKSADLQDTSWQTVSFDLSSVADNKSKVYVRWGIASDGAKQFSGWAIDDVVVTSASADIAGSIIPSGLTTFPPTVVATNADGTPNTAIWQIGPAVAGGGQLDTTVTPNVTLGADPGTNAAGVAGGTVIGTIIGGNYPASMTTPVYLTWGPIDTVGLTGSALSFSRWLGVEDSKYDRARVELATTLDAATVFEDKASSTIKAAATAGDVSKTYEISTAKYFFAGVASALTVKYASKGLVTGEAVSIQYTTDKTASPVAWTTLTTDAVNTPVDTVVTYTAALPVAAADNVNFAVRVLLTVPADTSTAQVTVSGVMVAGVLWTKVFENPTAGATGTNNTFDDKWNAVSYDVSALADNKATVWVRWSIGPSDDFAASEYGGWSLDQIKLTVGSRVWTFLSETVPASLLWESSGAVTVNVKNAGGAAWDSGYKLYPVEGVLETVPDLGNPGATKDVVGLDTAAGIINRWGIGTGGVAVTGTVAPGANTAFSTNVTAPPLSSVTYKVSTVMATAPADAATSVLNADWAMASKTSAADVAWMPTYLGLFAGAANPVLGIANAGIVTSRFPDVQPGTDGNWARYWIEELAGRSPLVVQGFPNGTYRPLNPITRDQIAVYIARAAQLTTPTQASGAVFHDISRDYWAALWIEQCAAAGIVSGFPDKSYQPLLEVHRDAMTKFIALGAGITLVPAPTAMSAPGWFSDVNVVAPAAGETDTRNVFRDYINTLFVNNVVQGFGDNPDHPTYRPDLVVSRDQLAVFVWRAFMRDDSSIVVLGGPDITAVNPIEPVTFYGYTSAPSIVASGDQYYAYVTLDAVRLKAADLASVLGGDAKLDVVFKLEDKFGRAGLDLSFPTSVSAADLATWIADVTGPTASGEPYKNVAVAIPTTTASRGDWNLVVSIEGKELARQPAFAVVGNVLVENFDDSSSLLNWTLFGQPTPLEAAVALYPQASVTSPNADLFLGVKSLQLQNTQQVVRQIDTTGLHNLTLSVFLAAAGLGSADSVNVAWSADYGVKGASAIWNSLYSATGSAVPAKLTKQTFNLPNSTDKTKSPPILGADDNSAFAVRLSINAANSTPKAFFDDLVLRGS